MRRSENNYSNKAPSSVCSSRSAIPPCLRHSIRQSGQTERSSASGFPNGDRMNVASGITRTSMESRSSQAEPIVFVVDDDISVRESLELLIHNAGLQPQLFES